MSYVVKFTVVFFTTTYTVGAMDSFLLRQNESKPKLSKRDASHTTATRDYHILLPVWMGRASLAYFISDDRKVDGLEIGSHMQC